MLQGKACYQNLPLELRQKILYLSANWNEEPQHCVLGLDHIKRHALATTRAHELGQVHELVAADISYVEKAWKKDLEFLLEEQLRQMKQLGTETRAWSETKSKMNMVGLRRIPDLRAILSRDVGFHVRTLHVGRDIYKFYDAVRAMDTQSAEVYKGFMARLKAEEWELERTACLV